MRFFRTLPWLALVATACVSGLHFVVPPSMANNLAGQIGYGINRWLMIFVPSAVWAGIAALVTTQRQPPGPYPGLVIGIFVAGLFTLMIVAVCLALSFL